MKRLLALPWFQTLVATALACSAHVVHAQAPAGSDRLPPGAVAESLTVMRQLDDSVNKGHGDAATWYRRGMIAWALWERSRHTPPVRGLDWTTLSPRADTSLRRALELDPENDEYFRAAAGFLLSSGVSFRVWGPFGVFNDRLAEARRSGDAQRIAATALEAGRMYWLQYDHLDCEMASRPANATTAPLAAVEGRPTRAALPSAGPLGFLTPATASYFGESVYLKADLLFREAYEAAPAMVPTFRRYAMLLADQMRWTALAVLAQNQVAITPSDGWAWMTLGLAAHKLGDAKRSATAFDTALARLDADERHRLDRIERVLDPLEAERLRAFSDTARAVAEQVYWRNADPLWTVPGTEPRVEFLARMAFAELRWTQEELNLNGVNTENGNSYIRTGRVARRGCTPMRAAWYFANDTSVLRGQSANWTRIARVRIDTIPTQVARFRSVLDSTDVVVATLPPVAAISRASQVAGPVRTDFWILEGGLTEVQRDSVRPARPGPKLFIHRLAPGGYVYRTEATADGATLAARGTAGFIAGKDSHTGFATSGVGMSDVLIASRLAPRRVPARRWTDFDVTPLLGPVAPNATMSLLFEVYDLAEENGAARYGISITVQREVTATTQPGRVAASIVGRVGGNIDVTRTADKVELSFERTVPHAATLVDNVTLNLGKSPPGNYLVTLRITDRVTGALLGRTQRLVVPPSSPPRPTLYGK